MTLPPRDRPPIGEDGLIDPRWYIFLTRGKFSFSVSKTNSQTGVVAITETKVTFGTVNWNIGGFYDGTSKWTPPPGLIRLSALVAFADANMEDLGTQYLVFYKNGASFRYGSLQRTGAAQGDYLNGTILDNAGGADYYEVYAYTTTSAGTATINNTSYFEGHQL